MFLGSLRKILAPTSARPPTNREKWKHLLALKFLVSLQGDELFSGDAHSYLCLIVHLVCVSERVMPYFAQEPLSYLTLPTIKNAYKSFSIKINFRPDNVDGESTSASSPSGFLPHWIFELNVGSLWVCTLSHVLTLNSPASLVPFPSPPLHLLLAPSWWWEGLVLYAGECPRLRAAAAQVESSCRACKVHPAQDCEGDGAWPLLSDRLPEHFWAAITKQAQI